MSTALNYEDVLEKTYRRLIKPGFQIADIGAHLGRHTIVYSQLVGPGGRVYAFEPLADVFNRLQAGLLDAGIENVFGFNMALGAERGVLSFVRADGALEESGLRERQLYNQPDHTSTRRVNVWCDRLDHLFADIRRLDYVKIDVEGAEVSVLEGGRNLLRKTRPMISVEYGVPTYSAYGLTSDSLWSWCEGEQYEVFDVFSRPIESAQRFREVCEEQGTIWDFWLVPRESKGAFASATEDLRVEAFY